jgi:YidC/Oxa1 family membrane protein insertase
VTSLLNPLYYAVAWIIMRLHAWLGALFGPSSGWAWALSIVVLVILMRLAMLPLFIKQMHATRKMTALAPQVAELKKRYKNDKQRLNEETMKLYKENGANPLAGCLPVVAQLPVFFALFGVLRAISLDQPKYGLTQAVVASAQHAHIFGVTVADRFLSHLFPPVLYPISAASRTVILLTVLVSATTTFLTVRQSMKRGMTPTMTPDNPMASSQKFMSYIVPVFALSGLYWQYGLVLYWVTTNLWTLGQQHVLFKRFPPLEAQAGAAGGAGAGGGKPAGPKAVAGRTAAGKTGPGARPPARTQDVKQVGRGPGGRAPAGAKPGGNAQQGKAPANAKSGAAAGQAGSAPANGQPGSNGKADSTANAAGTGAPAAAGAPAGNGKPGGAGKPGGSGKAGGSAKPAGTAKPAANSKPQAKPGGKGAAKPATPRTDGKAPAAAPANGAGAALRRLVRGRTEAEPPPAEPETKIVRQQRVRQSRSRRSGKR